MNNIFVELDNLQYASRGAQVEERIESITDPQLRKIFRAYHLKSRRRYREGLDVLADVGEVGGAVRDLKDIVLADILLILDPKKAEVVSQTLSQRISEESPDLVQLFYAKHQANRYNQRDPSRAVKHHITRIEIARRMGARHHYITAKSDLSVIYRYLGRYADALEQLSDIRENIEEMTDPNVRGIYYSNLGTTYYHLNEFEEASRYFDIGGEELQGASDAHYIQLLFIKMVCYLKMGRKDEIEAINQEIKKIGEGSDDHVIQPVTKIANAVYLKHSPRLRQRVKALELFEEITNEEIFDYEWYFLALINQIELLISEFSESEEEEVFQEISELLSKLERFGSEDEGIYFVEICQLKARLLFVKNEIQEAIDLIEDGLKVVEAESARKELEAVREMFFEQLHRWSSITEQNKGLIERISHSQILEYIKQVMEIIK